MDTQRFLRSLLALLFPLSLSVHRDLLMTSSWMVAWVLFCVVPFFGAIHWKMGIATLLSANDPVHPNVANSHSRKTEHAKQRSDAHASSRSFISSSTLQWDKNTSM